MKPGGWPAAGVLALALAAGGCSLQKLAVSSLAPVIEDSLAEAFASGDIQTAREAIPGQLLLLRGLCRSDPDKVELWTAAVQLYTVYGLIFIEAEDPDRAATLYSEGCELGLRFLMRRTWFREAWESGPDALRAAIGDRRPHSLAPLMMWTAACLGKHVLGHLDQPREVAGQPFVHVLADAAIDMQGDYFYGMPYVLKAIVLSATPRLLGGDPETAAELFRRAFRLTERRFLCHQTFYAQYYCTATLQEDLFDEILQEVLEAPEDIYPEVRLINRVARQRAALLSELREDLF